MYLSLNRILALLCRILDGSEACHQCLDRTGLQIWEDDVEVRPKTKATFSGMADVEVVAELARPPDSARLGEAGDAPRPRR
jgi:hypothetical protein